MAKFNDLYLAVKARDCARLRKLVQGGIDVDCRDSRRRSVLHHAAEMSCGDRNVIRTLVNLGADINAQDIERKTPLHYCLSDKACEDLVLSIMKHVQIVVQNKEEYIRLSLLEKASAKKQALAVKFLVELGADINARCYYNVTSLHRAIQLNNIQGIQTLLRLGVDVNKKTAINFTALNLVLGPSLIRLIKHLVKLGADVNSGFSDIPPLIQAVELGRMDIIELLVQYGANINDYRFDNITPVICAVQERLPTVVECLVQLGADLNAKRLCSHAICEVVKVGRMDVLEYLFRHGADEYTGLYTLTALGISVFCQFHEMVDCLGKNGVDVNFRFDLEIPPLVTAMRLGKTEMMKALVKLEPQMLNGNIGPVLENITVLVIARNHDPKIMKLLLKYGGDVNFKYDNNASPIHDAVAQGNIQMVRLLVKLGANVNKPKTEGITLIHQNLYPLLNQEETQVKAMTELLVEAGLDLNLCNNHHVSPLHDAVRLGNLNMVRTLAELGADINASKTQGSTLLSQAFYASRTDMIRYFTKKGADVNTRIKLGVSPLHDAVRYGNVDMVPVLINCGASSSGKTISTVLYQAIIAGNNEVVKCLLECGADINAQTRSGISALHDAVEYSDLVMTLALAKCRYHEFVATDKVTPLAESVCHNKLEITETLLKHGADLNCLQCISLTPLDMALDEDKLRHALFLLMIHNTKACRDTIGSSPLHRACQLGYIDTARLLIIEGSDVNKDAYHGRKPLEMLPLAKTADYHVLQETVTAAKVTEQVSTSFISLSGCQDMATSLHTPGIGDVRYISSPSTAEISLRVSKLLSSIIQQSRAVSGWELKLIGSTAEGTRVGLPNEMDFLFESSLMKGEKDDERKIVAIGNGYVKYDYVTESFQKMQQSQKKKGIDHCTFNMFKMTAFGHVGSSGFHHYFEQEVMLNAFIGTPNSVSDEKVSIQPNCTQIIGTDRKACSILLLMWNDGDAQFHIPVDIVPCLHINNWPEGAITRTWLMDEQELRSRGYVLVPKPPHVKSDLAKKCTEEELQTLWKISFPHLEAEHMQRLEQRVKDVYLTAKCLRNPDVCRIMITDDGSLPRNVDKYVTSYLLKMCFFKNVDRFRQHNWSLEEMVCKVYTELVVGLSKNFIPLFFLPKVSTLSGIKLDVAKCVKVAKIMARFVRALYERDCLDKNRVDIGDDQVTASHQQNPSIPSSVYRIYDISAEEV